MAKLYGFGASVVIIGALFKIMHYPGSQILLPLGLGTEALIFFFSAFEPPHQEPDWTLVYPELAGMYDEELKDELMSSSKGRKKAVGGGDAISQELDKMLEDAKIGPELIESLGNSFKSLSENTSKFADISMATVATGEYVDNVKGASKAVNQLTDTYKKTNQTLSEDASITQEYSNNLKNVTQASTALSSAYSQVSEAIQKDIQATEEFAANVKAAAGSVNELKTVYTASAEKLAATTKTIDFSAVDGTSFNKQLQELTKNIEALNNSYQLQLLSLNEQQDKPKEMGESMKQMIDAIKASSDDIVQLKQNLGSLNSKYTEQIQASNDQIQQNKLLEQGLGQFIQNVTASADYTKTFQAELVKLTQNISALNNVYGNMLSAMNIKVN